MSMISGIFNPQSSSISKSETPCIPSPSSYGRLSRYTVAPLSSNDCFSQMALITLSFLIFTVYLIVGFARKGIAYFRRKEHVFPIHLDSKYEHGFVQVRILLNSQKLDSLSQLSNVKLHYVAAGDQKAPPMVRSHTESVTLTRMAGSHPRFPRVLALLALSN